MSAEDQIPFDRSNPATTATNGLSRECLAVIALCGEEFPKRIDPDITARKISRSCSINAADGDRATGSLGDATATATDGLGKDRGGIAGKGDETAHVAQGHGLGGLEPSGIARTDLDGALSAVSGTTTTTDCLIEDCGRELGVGLEGASVDQLGFPRATGGAIAAECGVTKARLDITTTTTNAVEIEGDG